MNDSMEALLRVGDVEKARAAADAVLAEEPSDKQALTVLAKVAAFEGDFAKAGQLVTRATLDGVDDVDTLLVKAAIAAQTKRDADGAKALYEKAIQLAKPPRAEPYFGLGMVLASLGQFANAAKPLAKAVELDATNGQYRFHLARALLAESKLAEGLPHLQKALELNPLYPPVYDGCVFILSEFGYVDAAERLLREGLKLMPEHPHLRALLGNVLVAQGKAPEAAKVVQKLATENPGDAGTLFNYARLLAATGQRDAALEMVQELEKREASTRVLALKAMLLETREPPDEDGAIAAYAKAAKDDSSDWRSLNNLGHLLMRRKAGGEAENLGAAVEALQESCRRAPYTLEPVLNLALAFARLGKKELATAAARDVVARARQAQVDLKTQAEKLLATL